jgi:hypothetical protein
MKRKGILWIGMAAAMLLAVAALAGETPAGKVDPKAAFEKLKGLAGEWSGTAGEGFPAPVIYKVSANGNVVMETLFPGTPHEMITMYHLAGDNLVATHYCSAGNQPHFKLDAEKSTPTELVFAFDGGTNFDPAKDGHIHEGKIGFAGDGKLENLWTFYAGGKQAESKDFHLTRK